MTKADCLISIRPILFGIWNRNGEDLEEQNMF